MGWGGRQGGQTRRRLKTEALECVLTTGLFFAHRTISPKRVSTSLAKPLTQQSLSGSISPGLRLLRHRHSGLRFSYWTFFALTVLPLYQVARIPTCERLLWRFGIRGKGDNGSIVLLAFLTRANVSTI